MAFEFGKRELGHGVSSSRYAGVGQSNISQVFCTLRLPICHAAVHRFSGASNDSGFNRTSEASICLQAVVRSSPTCSPRPIETCFSLCMEALYGKPSV